MAKNIDKDGWIDTTNDKVAASYIRRGADKILQKIYDDGHRDGTRTVVSPDHTSSTQIYVSPQHTAKQALYSDLLELIKNLTKHTSAHPSTTHYIELNQLNYALATYFGVEE